MPNNGPSHTNTGLHFPAAFAKPQPSICTTSPSSLRLTFLFDSDVLRWIGIFGLCNITVAKHIPFTVLPEGELRSGVVRGLS
jgi:hypothetical protein